MCLYKPLLEVLVYRKNIVFFKKKFVPLIGIDIGLTAVKLLELSGSRDKYRVENYVSEPLPVNAVVDRNIEQVDLVSEAISRGMQRIDSKVKTVAVSVAGSSVITKVIPMPAELSEADMELQIQLEADQYIPFPLEEVSMDFEILGPTEDSEDEVDVLLAASKSENVDLRVAAVEGAGLEAKIVDIEAFALENAIQVIANELLGGGQDRVIAVADIGSAITNLSVLENLTTIYSREQTFGGTQLTEDIQRRYGLSYEEAVLAKKRGGLPDGYETEVLQPFKESVAQQVHRAQQFFFSSNAITEIDHLILAGGCASIAGIAETVAEEVGIPTQIANPFSGMTISSKVPVNMLRSDAPSLLVACGLALRSFN